MEGFLGGGRWERGWGPKTTKAKIMKEPLSFQNPNPARELDGVLGSILQPIAWQTHVTNCLANSIWGVSFLPFPCPFSFLLKGEPKGTQQPFP